MACLKRAFETRRGKRYRVKLFDLVKDIVEEMRAKDIPKREGYMYMYIGGVYLVMYVLHALLPLRSWLYRNKR